MSLADYILDLPAEVTHQILDAWLSLEDVAYFDWAMITGRRVAHISVLQMPFCAQDHVLADCVNAWALARGIVVKRIILPQARNWAFCEQYFRGVGYLQKFGHFVDAIIAPRMCFNEAPFTSMIVSTVAQCCPVLKHFELTCSRFPMNILHELLNSRTHLESLKLRAWDDRHDNLSDLHVLTPSHIRIKDLNIDCPTDVEGCILNMCVPSSVEQMRITDIESPNWAEYTNLRRLSFCPYAELSDNTLQHVATTCPYITHWDLTGSIDTTEVKYMPSSAVVATIAQTMQNLVSLNVERISTVTGDIILFIAKCCHFSLTALHIYGCNNIEPAAINKLLSECQQLRVISFTYKEGVDCALLSKMTTIATDLCKMGSVWRTIQRRCTVLQHLHVVFLTAGVRVLLPTTLHITTAIAHMPALQTLHVYYMTTALQANFMDVLKVWRPDVRVKFSDNYEWYKQFD